MCTSPKTIIHRSNHYNETMPLYMKVPCGKCEDCKRTLKNEWFVRCYYEWVNNIGSTYFYTLTYNNEHLPHCCGVPCFEKRDIQLFIKRLRSVLSPLGFGLKYLITSEYGEKFQRPHYHALFFVDKHNNPYQFYKLVEETWKHGFVKYGDNVGRVTDCRGIQYVTKYVIKDYSYTDKFDELYITNIYKRYDTLLKRLFYRYPQRFKGIFLNLDKENRQIHISYLKDMEISDDLKDFGDKLYYKCRSQFQKHRPFHLQSSALGISIKDIASSLRFHEIVPVMQNGNVLAYPMPRYIKRKLWYDVVENELDGKRNKFVLSAEGKRHLIARLDDGIQALERKYSDIFKNMKRIDWETLEFVNGVYENPVFPSILDLKFWLDHFDLDLEMLAIYNKVFRNRVMPLDWKAFDFEKGLCKRNYIDFVEQSLDGVSSWDFGKAYELAKADFAVINSSLFNNHPFFEIYEHACGILDAILVVWKSQELRAKTEKEKLASITRQLFNKT